MFRRKNVVRIEYQSKGNKQVRFYLLLLVLAVCLFACTFAWLAVFH